MADHTHPTRQHQLHLLLPWQALVRDHYQVGPYLLWSSCPLKQLLRAFRRKSGLFGITLTKGMTLNHNLADRKALSSLTFLSTIRTPIDHVTCHMFDFVKK